MEEKINFPQPSFIEKRRSPRLNHHVPLQFRRLNSYAEPFSGCITKDISTTGLRIASEKFITPQTKLVLQFLLRKTTPIRAVGRVIWVQKAAHSDNYSMGLEFIEINKDKSDHINDYVRQNLPQI